MKRNDDLLPEYGEGYETAFEQFLKLACTMFTDKTDHRELWLKSGYNVNSVGL